LAIFDLDGVITSTTHEHYLGWHALFVRYYGLEMEAEIESLVKGISRADSYLRILQKYKIPVPPEKTFQQHLAYKNAVYLDLIDRFDSSRILPGVTDLLNRLRADGIWIALGSASRNASKLLKSIGLTEKFDYVVDPTDLPGKPDPGIFLDAMRHFELRPEDCVGLEDAQAGIDSIKAAGMTAVGVGPEKLVRADVTFRDLTELVGPNYSRLFEDTHGSSGKPSR
jgi:beta-phosphoglucomutase